MKSFMFGILTASVLLAGCQPNSDTSSDSRKSHNNTAMTEAEAMNIAPSYVDYSATNKQATTPRCQNDAIVTAFQEQQSDRQVWGCGTIIKALPDDNTGSRHQKILITLTNTHPEQTLLLVHNIDIAPRVANISKGTPIRFYGEYVYNDKGGLVHWTHHDPAARHQHGWIESGGLRYE